MSCYGVWLDDGELNPIVGRKKEIEEEYSIDKVKGYLSRILSVIKKHEGKK